MLSLIDRIDSLFRRLCGRICAREKYRSRLAGEYPVFPLPLLTELGISGKIALSMAQIISLVHSRPPPAANIAFLELKIIFIRNLCFMKVICSQFCENQ